MFSMDHHIGGFGFQPDGAILQVGAAPAPREIKDVISRGNVTTYVRQQRITGGNVMRGPCATGSAAAGLVFNEGDQARSAPGLRNVYYATWKDKLGSKCLGAVLAAEVETGAGAVG